MTPCGRGLADPLGLAAELVVGRLAPVGGRLSLLGRRGCGGRRAGGGGSGVGRLGLLRRALRQAARTAVVLLGGGRLLRGLLARLLAVEPVGLKGVEERRAAVAGSGGRQLVLPSGGLRLRREPLVPAALGGRPRHGEVRRVPGAELRQVARGTAVAALRLRLTLSLAEGVGTGELAVLARMPRGFWPGAANWPVADGS